jgi:hypothetical protein
MAKFKDRPTVHPDAELVKAEAGQDAAEHKAVALNGAANLILSMLSDPVRDMLMETASTTLGIPLWQLVAGLVQQAYDIGLFSTPQIDPDWISNLPSKPAVFNQARCGQCGEVFQPRWPKQEWCSNECGSAHQRGIVGNLVPGHIVGGANPLGLEPKGSVTSALRAADAE